MYCRTEVFLTNWSLPVEVHSCCSDCLSVRLEISMLWLWLRANVTSQPIRCPPTYSTPCGTSGTPSALVVTGSIQVRRLCSSLAFPEGFAERAQTRRFGHLTLHLASRSDQICFKVYAATDQGPDSKHFDDLNALAPTRNELIEAARWARTHDPSEGFQEELIALLQVMGMADAAQVV
jgi:hypothetical protein